MPILLKGRLRTAEKPGDVEGSRVALTERR
jgi:hypothetical protein